MLHDADDVRCVAAAGTLGVVGVDSAALEGADGLLDEAALVECVGVDEALNVVLVADGQTGVDGRGRAAPVLVELEADGTGGTLLGEALRQAVVALSGDAEVEREAVERLQHLADVGCAGGAGCGVCASAGPGAAAKHGRDAGGESFGRLLWTDVVDVSVEAAVGDDFTLAGNDVCVAADDEGAVDIVHDVRVARLADADDVPVLNPDVGFVDAGVVDDERVCDDEVGGLAVGAAGRLPHALTEGLAAAELTLVAIGGVVLLDLDKELCVAEADEVTRRGAEHGGVCLALHGRWEHRTLIHGRIDVGKAHLGEVVNDVGNVDTVAVDDAAGNAVAALDDHVPANLDDGDGLAVAGLEAYGRTGRNVEAVAVGLDAVELEERVGLDEMVVAANLHGAVSLVDNAQTSLTAARVELNAAPDSHDGAGLTDGLVFGGRGDGWEERFVGNGEEGAVESFLDVAIIRGDGVVDGHEVGAVVEGALNLDLLEARGHGGEDVPATQHLLALVHERGDGVCAISDELMNVIGDEGRGFGLVETDSTGEALLGEVADLGDEELVDLGEELAMTSIQLESTV